jgi:cellulose synthase/poly-beta-1,6-N-acetylglucosamine synthase-like glycosyltransferase
LALYPGGSGCGFQANLQECRVYLATLAGPSLWTRLLFALAGAVVIGDFCATLVTVLYQRSWYARFIRPRFSRSYAPRCAVIVPCKGANGNLQSNLESFFNLDYPDYEVIFVTEDARDAAMPVIETVIAGRQNGIGLSAGLSTRCAQKNHNLLAGIDAARGAEVYIFADSDVRPRPEWLRELILPLGNDAISVVSGFRWLHAKNGNAGEWMHAYANIFIYVTFSCAFFLGGVGLWGGSMAIRRREFESLGVAAKWSRAVVDDLSLSQLIYKSKLKGVLVPSCMAHSDELFQDIKGGLRWFERQIMFLKVYFKPIWFFLAFPIVLAGVALMALLPAALLLGHFRAGGFFAHGGGAAVLFYIGELLTVMLYPLMGPMPNFLRFLVLQPFLRAMQAVSFLRTLIAGSIVWAGVRYHLKFFGDVSRVERPPQP